MVPQPGMSVDGDGERTDSTLPKELRTKVNRRKRHRAYVTRVMNQVEDCLKNFVEE